jgi:SAM-dependent methyltransferase
MSDSPVFDAYSRYYDLLYQDKDYEGEVEYIDSLLQAYGVSGCCELLEFGSGTGKHGRLLAEKGYNITGIELSDSMVQKAQRTDGFTCQQGDIRTVNLGRSFDAVLALFHVVSYQTTNADVQAVFQRASEHLKNGGIFVFDVWYSPAVYNLKPETRVKRMIDDEVEVIRIAEPDIRPNENRVDVNYTVLVKDKLNSENHTFSETHPMRHFSIPEIDLLSIAAGFQRLTAEEFLTGAEPGEQTWGVCFVIKKV